MTDRPILFSAPMVRALLDGRKTQTRRVLKPQPPQWAAVCSAIFPPQGLFQWSEAEHDPPRPLKRWPEDHALRVRFAKGDRLWVKETWRAQEAFDHMKPSEIGRESADEIGQPGVPVFYEADGKCDDRSVEAWQQSPPGKTRVSIHMPRWASRLTLTVRDVRVQRLQEISEEDAEAEGCPECPQCHGVGWINSGPDGGWQCPAKGCGDAYVDQYARLWNEINGAGAWAANPWIVALTFTVERRNIDAARAA